MAWNVTGSFDKASYVAGETMVYTISGDYTHDDTQGTQFSGSFGLLASNGDTTSLSFGPIPITTVTTVHENVAIVGPIVDTGGRAWTIAADGKSMTATA